MTIADRSRNHDRDSSVVVTSKLFQHIAAKVWKNGIHASLCLNIITSLNRQIKQSGSIEKKFGCIEDLYEDDISTIAIQETKNRINY